jgi:hypothetical protein
MQPTPSPGAQNARSGPATSDRQGARSGSVVVNGVCVDHLHDGSGQLRVDLHWGYTNTGCSCPGVRAPVPHGDDEVRVASAKG